MLKQNYLLNKKNLLIFLSILISFLASTYLIKNVFIASSPRVNPYFVYRLKNAPRQFSQYVASLPQLIFRKSSKEIPFSQIEKMTKSVDMKPITKGVYAGEKDKVKFYKIKENEVDWQEMTLKTKSGKTIKLRYPKGQPPLKEIVDIIKSE